jgi:N-methylhydantoinase A
VLAGFGADPRELAMIAYGGNGAVHAWAIAAELGINRVLVPKTAPAFSALGVLVADPLVDLIRSYVVPLSQVDMDRLRVLIREIDEEASKELEPTGLAGDEIERELFVQMSYQGQNFDMSVPVPEGVTLTESGLLDLADRFHDLHEADRGFSFRNQQPIVRGVRVVARGLTPKPDHLGEAGTVADTGDAQTASRPVWFGTGFVDTPTYDGARLGVGASVTGPALIEEPFTVVVVPPGSICTLGEHLSYELTSG